MGITPSHAPHRDHLFWAFCRVIAQKTRLALLRELILNPGLNVTELTLSVDRTESAVSMHLKQLHTAGLVVPYRQDQQVLYSVEAPANARFALQILPFLIKTLEKEAAYDPIIRMATAFTHQRRIEILRLLRTGPQSADYLMEKTKMKRSSFYRQIHKLEGRGFISQAGADYGISCPNTPLAKALLKAALG